MIDAHTGRVCGKVFNKPARLLRHQRSHTNERPFLCGFTNNLGAVCPEAFMRPDHLKRHMASHTGNKHVRWVCARGVKERGGGVERGGGRGRGRATVCFARARAPFTPRPSQPAPPPPPRAPPQLKCKADCGYATYEHSHLKRHMMEQHCA